MNYSTIRAQKEASEFLNIKFLMRGQKKGDDSLVLLIIRHDNLSEGVRMEIDMQANPIIRIAYTHIYLFIYLEQAYYHFKGDTVQ